MKTISRTLPTTQDLDDFLDAFDRLAPDHVSGGHYRKFDISRLRNNLLYIKALQSPKNVDEWVSMTEEHYVSIRNAVEEYDAERNEQRLTAADYGLSHRVA